MQASDDCYPTYGIDFVDAARLRVVARGWRIAANRKYVANASNRPCSQQCSLQSDQIQIPSGQMRNGLDSARLECAGYHHRIHTDARQRAAVNVNRIDTAGRHDPVD